MNRIMWRTWAALAVVVLAVVLDWWWVWGVWMCYYATVGIREGEIFLVEPVSRYTHPLLFWIVTAMWAGLGILILIVDYRSPLASLVMDITGGGAGWR